MAHWSLPHKKTPNQEFGIYFLAKKLAVYAVTLERSSVYKSKTMCV